MKKISIIVIPLIFLLSCKHPKKSTIILHKIKGDWVTDRFYNGWHEGVLIFSFNDSTCSYLYPYGQYSNFSISSDTLIINEKIQIGRHGQSGGKDKYYFKILALNNKKLSISPITDKTKDLLKSSEIFNPDTINLRKIQPKNNAQIERIAFYSTGCYGTCPSMYLEIDSIGNIWFNGQYFTEKKGLYSGKIPHFELLNIFQKVHNIQLDSLKKGYAAPWTDDQTCGVKIKTNLTEYESSAYGFDQEPVELRILFHKLMEIYKVAKLKRDSTITKKFLFSDFQQTEYQLPPPLPIKK